MESNNFKIIKALPIWRDGAKIKTLHGGITNRNYLLSNKEKQYVVRIGNDIPEHLIFRRNEQVSSKAAYQIGISPKVIHSGKGVLVLDYIKSKTLSDSDVRNKMDRIIDLIKNFHQNMQNQLIGAPVIFWVFHVIRHYSKFLISHESNHSSKISYLLECCNYLEELSSPHYIVYGHNDLLAANFLDDGKKIWLIDWEYAGYNDPLFDLGGLASNNNFQGKQEISMLEKYFESKVDNKTIKRYQAMKTSSLLRETMWSMVSEISSKIDFDYSEYTQENLTKFEKSFKSLKAL